MKTWNSLSKGGPAAAVMLAGVLALATGCVGDRVTYVRAYPVAVQVSEPLSPPLVVIPPPPAVELPPAPPPRSGGGDAFGGRTGQDVSAHRALMCGHPRHPDHPRPADWWYHPANRRETRRVVNNVTVVNNTTIVNQNPTMWRPRTAGTVADRGDRGWGQQEVRAITSARNKAAKPAPADACQPPVAQVPAPETARPGNSQQASARAAAHVEGYHRQARIMTDASSPYHGYYFKILSKQGKHAPGGKYDYIINGHMIGDFALVAWPAEWGNSGVVTFIVNQQGKIYQKNLGPKIAVFRRPPSTPARPTAQATKHPAANLPQRLPSTHRAKSQSKSDSRFR